MADSIGDVQPPKQNVLANQIAAQLDSNGSVRTWLATYLIADNSCRVQIADILEAYAADFDLEPSTPDRPAMTMEQLKVLIKAVFLFTFIDNHSLGNVKMQIPSVVGLRWKRLPKTTIFSHTVHVKQWILNNVPINVHAQQFLYMNQPYRTLAWLLLYFSLHPNSSISLDGLYNFYCTAFNHATPTYKILDRPKFVGCVLGTIEGSQLKQVSKRHFVIHGIAFSPVKRSTEVVLQDMRRGLFYGLVREGEIEKTPPKNNFAKAMWEENVPLLMLPSNIPGPVSDRLCRRGQYPTGPLYTEEPGFPGIDFSNVTRKGVRKNKPKTSEKQTSTLPAESPAGRPLTEEDLAYQTLPKETSTVLQHQGDSACCPDCRINEAEVAEALEGLALEDGSEQDSPQPQKRKKAGKGKGKGKRKAV